MVAAQNLTVASADGKRPNCVTFDSIRKSAGLIQPVPCCCTPKRGNARLRFYRDKVDGGLPEK